MKEVSKSQNKAAGSGLSPSFSVFLKGHSHNAVALGGTYIHTSLVLCRGCYQRYNSTVKVVSHLLSSFCLQVPLGGGCRGWNQQDCVQSYSLLEIQGDQPSLSRWKCIFWESFNLYITTNGEFLCVPWPQDGLPGNMPFTPQRAKPPAS